MFTSLFIIVVSVVMFGYWFRYTCVLLLSTRQAHDIALNVVQTHGLSFRSINANGISAEVDAQLQRDYRVLRTLLKRNSSGYEVEVSVLQVHYLVTRTWWRMTRGIAPGAASKAIKELTMILDNWATVVGMVEQQAVSAC